MRKALRRRLDRHDDSGMTLVELLVSMIVFSVAIAMVYSAVILTMQWSRETQQSADAVTELRNALAQIDRQVRSGNVLLSPANETTAGCQSIGTHAGTCMRIFTQSNGDEKCVQWQLLPDGTAENGTPVHVLQSRSWAMDWQSTGNFTGWSVVARDLTLGTDAPFTLLGASTPYKERSLQVHLEVMDERQDKPVAIDSTVTGRNTSYGYDAGQCAQGTEP